MQPKVIKVECPRCIVCGKQETVEITQEQYRELINGTKFVQAIFPDWSAERRELLITGTHPECWDELFGDDEELN